MNPYLEPTPQLGRQIPIPPPTPTIRNRGLVAAVLASCLVVVLAGCATVSGQKDKTYRAHGVSFEYPGGWRERAAKFAAGESNSNELWRTSVGAGDVDLVAIEAFRLNVPVTRENLNQAKAEFSRVIPRLFGQIGGAVQAGPVETTVNKLPALRYTATGSVRGNPIESAIVIVFNGTTEYFINAQHTRGKATEIEKGLDQILRTFTVT